MKYYTHAGLFHADEVTGYAICSMAGVVNQFIRLKDINNLHEDGLIADIGREYDHDSKRYDHHQGFITREDDYPYASAGLLWKHYGYKVVRNEIPDLEDRAEDSILVDKIVNMVDENLIKGIDAHDSDNNYQQEFKCSAGDVTAHTLSNIISYYNYSDVSNENKQRKQFRQVVDIVKNVITYHVHDAYQYFHDVARFSEVVSFDGGVAVSKESIKWRRIVHDKYPKVKFFIQPSNHPGSKYAMMCVTEHPSSRKNIIDIERPEWFDGFIHQGKWIAGSDDVDELVRLGRWNIERKLSKNLNWLQNIRRKIIN